MHIITQARIWAAKKRWPQAASALDAWYRLMKMSEPSDFAGMKALFPATDKVGRFHVFDIGGNKMRLIAVVQYKFKKIYIQAIMDHTEYDTADGRRKSMRPLVKEAVEHWPHVAPLLTMPTDQKDYDRLVQAMDQILALVGEDEDHPLALLASRMGDLIEAYDEAHRPMPQVTGAAALRAIMTERGLGQGDLPEVGTQSVLSEILSGKRQINVRQAKALSERFAFPAAGFRGLWCV